VKYQVLGRTIGATNTQKKAHCLKNALKKYDATSKYRTAYTANNAQQNFVCVGNKSSRQQAG
jgi:predicted transport protein